MGLGPCSSNCLARVIGRVVGIRGGADGLNDDAAGLGRRFVLELRSRPLADIGEPAGSSHILNMVLSTVKKGPPVHS